MIGGRLGSPGANGLAYCRRIDDVPSTPLREQRRGRKIAMSAAELDTFLGAERTCRVATASPSGVHNTPLWFAWDGSALWLYSIVRSQRWADLQRDPRVAVVVDAGEEYSELRGVELTGTVTFVGEAPRPVDAAADPVLADAERIFADKYTGGTFLHDGRHGWIKVHPAKIASWDFRKVFGAGASAGPS